MEPSHKDAVFGRWMRRRRRALDLTQKELGRRVGCSTIMVRKIERDERRPSRKVAMALGRELGVPDEERDAFVRFARSGWADGPPDATLTATDMPWLQHDRPTPSAGTAQPASGDRPPSSPEPGSTAWHDTGTRAGPSRAVAGGTRPPSAPAIVARDRELERLNEALGDSLERRGRILLVAGETGQGKSTLLRTFATRAQAEHPSLLIAAGTCDAFTGEGDPFLPFKEILQQLTGDVESASSSRFEQRRAERLRRSMAPSRRIVQEYGPHLVDTLLGGERFLRQLREAGADDAAVSRAAKRAQLPDPSHDGGAFGERGLRSEVVHVLTRISARTPLLLIVDDLQWADASSLDLLLHLSREIPGHHVLVVGSYRAQEIAPRADGSRHPMERIVNELERQFGDLVIDLDATDGRAFLDALLDAEPNLLGHAFREALWRQTGGQPLFTVELLRAMQERGDLTLDEAGRWMAGPDLTWGSLPTRINGALQERVARLSPFALDVLRTASVEGEAFTAEVVAAVLGSEARSVVEVLSNELGRMRQLVAPGTVGRTPVGLVTRYRFRHGLFRNYVCDDLHEGERAYLHEAVARALQEAYGADVDPVAVAYHFAQAQAPEEAAPFHARAGDRARRSGATSDAVVHYRRALEGSSNLDVRRRGRLLRDLGECLWLKYEVDEAVATLEQARACFEGAGEPRLVGAVVFQLGRIAYDRQPDPRTALVAYRRGLELLEDGSESPELARGLNAVAQVHMEAGDDEQALAQAQRALAMAERLGIQDARADARMTVGAVLARSGPERREEGLAMLRESSESADSSGPFGEAIYGAFGLYAAYWLAGLYEALGRLDEADAQWEVCIERAARHEMVVLHLDTRMQRWRLDWRRGRWAQSLAFLEFLREQHRAGAKPSFSAAGVELDLGRVAEARDLMERHVARAMAPVVLSVRGFALRELLRSAVALGDLRAADRYAYTLVDAAGRRPAYSAAVVGPILTALQWLASRNGVRPREAVGACYRVLQTAERQFGSPEARASVAEAEGAMAVADGDASRGAARLARAAELWGVAGYPLERARAGCAASRAFGTAGSLEDARRLGQDAATVLDALASQLPDGEHSASFGRARRAWESGDALYL